MTMQPGAKGFYRGDSLLIGDGMIQKLGYRDECRMAASGPVETISLGGRIVLPAFIDTHTHFVEMAKRRFELVLTGLESISAYKDAMINFRKRHNPMPAWVLGGGWDANVVDSPRRIDKHFLDKLFPDVPVVLFSKDYHAKWCNSLALNKCGITKLSTDPYGGRIVRDDQGEPNGILLEKATEITDLYVEPPSRTEVLKAIRHSVGDINRMGITGIHSMEGVFSAGMLAECLDSGSPFHVCWHFPLEELDNMIAKGYRSYDEDDGMRTGGVKIFADGSLGSQTAAMFDPYPGEPGRTGILRYTADNLYAIASHAAANGIAVTIHAIGDLTVNIVIEALRKVKSHYPYDNLLQRIEHVQSIRRDDIQRLKDSGAYCALQPIHLANDIPMIEKYWAGIQDTVYAFRSFADKGIPFGFGSDAPIESINPFWGIYCATNRRFHNDPSQAVWHPEQLLDVETAINAYTYGAACGSREQHKRGSIEVGKDADLIVLDDWTQQEPDFWLNCLSRLTMFQGRIVHDNL